MSSLAPLTSFAPPAPDCGSHAPAPAPACATPIDPPALVAALLDDPAHAHALLAALSPAQRVCQALEHAGWLNAHGVPRSANDVLADWQALVAAAQMPQWGVSTPPPEPRLVLDGAALVLCCPPTHGHSAVRLALSRDELLALRALFDRVDIDQLLARMAADVR